MSSKPKPKILVTTAAGDTGKATTLALLEKGFPVRAFVRKHDSRSKELEKAGAEVFVGNMMDFADVTRSLEGVRRAYVCAPPDHHCLHKSVAFGIAAEDAKLDAIVWMGQWLSDPQHRSLPTRETYYSDRVLQWLPNVHQHSGEIPVGLQRTTSTSWGRWFNWDGCHCRLAKAEMPRRPTRTWGASSPRFWKIRNRTTVRFIVQPVPKYCRRRISPIVSGEPLAEASGT